MTNIFFCKISNSRIIDPLQNCNVHISNYFKNAKTGLNGRDQQILFRKLGNLRFVD